MPTERSKYRHITMDEMDDAILSLALRDAFPTTVFYPSGRSLTAPRLELCRTIPECGSSVVTAYAPAPGWQPEFEEYKDNPRWYVIRNPPRRYLHYSRTSWFWGSWEPAHWAFDLPTPEFGTISTNYDPNDAEQRAFVNGVWKIISKLATNRMKSGISKDRVVLSENVGGGMIWAGHNLLKWCALKPGRMIDGSHLPCDDWKFPETPWYRDLHARALAMFGPEFGGAPEKSPRSAEA